MFVSLSVISSVLCQSTLDALCPYKGWTLYFTEGTWCVCVGGAALVNMIMMIDTEKAMHFMCLSNCVCV